MNNKELCKGESGGISLDKHHSLIKQSIMPTGNMSGFAEPANTKDENFDKLKQAKAPTTKKYIGCKIIAAEPMTQEAFLKWKGTWQENQETYGDGYKVIYADNYISWSPKKVFEEAYREITMSEYALLHS